MPTCSFPVLVVVGVVLVTLLVIGLSVGLGVRARNTPKSDIATDFYSPGDSRLISLSSFFCDSVRFSVESRLQVLRFFLLTLLLRSQTKTTSLSILIQLWIKMDTTFGNITSIPTPEHQ